jgi:plasmid stability protein
MPQLLVRDLDQKLVNKLRRRAAAEGTSVEEAHRRLLRKALSGKAGPELSFLEFLRSAPKDDGVHFPRSTDLPRTVSL